MLIIADDIPIVTREEKKKLSSVAKGLDKKDKEMGLVIHEEINKEYDMDR